jgi:hypothetical protein
MKEFLKSNDTKWRLARTIVQGLIAVVIANLDLIVGYTAIDPAIRPIVTGLVMAVLSPIMSELGGKVDASPDM